MGSLRDLDILRKGAGDADAVIHTAFGLDLTKIEDLADEDRQAIEKFGETFSGSDRRIVITGGIGVDPSGRPFHEDERPPVIPDFPRASEQTAFHLADLGLNACVVRNPRSVHGQGENHGFVPMLAKVAREKGVSAWIGDGANLWPSVHRLDAARLYTLAIERGGRGEAYHAVAEEAIPFRQIAEGIGKQLGLPVKALTQDEAEAHFGPLARWVAGNGPASSEKTRRSLGWEPKEVGLVADIGRPDYSA